MATEQRLIRLEGAYEHLATKADLAALESRLLRWIIPTILGGIAGGVGIAAAVARLTA